jgi:hypothetical protein
MSNIPEKQIRDFVAAWYQALDFHLPIEQVYPLLAADGLKMAFPDGDISDPASFKVWYDRVTNLFFDENHFVNEVKITPDGDCYVLDIIVGWQASWWEAPSPKSKRVSMDATQRWIVRPTKRNPHGLEIMFYNATVEPFKYAPGFARL